MNIKKKTVLIISIIAAGVLLGGIVLAVLINTNKNRSDNFNDSDDVFVTFNYYNGIVEPEGIFEIKREEEREIEGLFVSVGDKVTKGQKLFSYKTQDKNIELEQAQIEYEQIQSEIEGYRKDIKELKEQKESAPESEKLEYSIRIQEMESSLRQAELNLKIKDKSIAEIKDRITNSTVVSPADGTVNSINSLADYSSAYITVSASGAVRVKCKIDELNISTISEGDNVLVRPRSDENKNYYGTITKIETKNTAEENNSYDEPSEDIASKYYFYVTLENADDLLIGQHVYVQPNFDGMSDGEEDIS